MIKLANLLKEITIQKPSNKITAYFEKDGRGPTSYSSYGSVKSEDNPTIPEEFFQYTNRPNALTAVVPRTAKAGLGILIHSDEFPYGGVHDNKDNLINALKKRGIQAFGGMYDGNLVVWIPEENTNITRQD